MWCALQQDAPGDYVVATGETRTLRECCEIAFGHVGLNWEQHVVAGDRTPEDEASPAGDATKAREQLGWEPGTSFEELIRLMVDADLKLLGG
jgi:GDPmannose 4,6-dehydratase